MRADLGQSGKKRPGKINLAGVIDHTLLKADATRQDIETLCEEAKAHGFATVCVNSSYIPLAVEKLRGSHVKPIAVVGFPLGAASSASKAFEAKQAVRDGAEEIDMVVHLGALKSRDYAYVTEDIRAVVQAAHPAPVKVILETAQLTDNEKITACSLAKAAGAAFVKTSTGFGGGGATVADVKLMRETVGPELGVKASGGVKSRDDAFAMIEAGATRIGTSSGVALVSGQKSANGSY